MAENDDNPSTESSVSSSADLAESADKITDGATVALIVNNPTLGLADKSNEEPNEMRLRRRSSVSIIQAIANTSHLLSTIEARKRNFLVGSARQLPESTTNDIHSYFPSGRLLSIMMVTWNTGEASKLYEQNYTPTARETAQPKERMLDDIADILLPTFIDYVSDLIIVCTQEMSAAKKRIEWEILLQEVIGPTHVLYHSVHFGTLSLCIFLRRDLIWFCTEPEEKVVKFRAVNPRRTKGSLVINFNLFGTSFTVINSHFEAGHTAEGRSSRRVNFQSTLAKCTTHGHGIPKVNSNTSASAQPKPIDSSEASQSVDTLSQLVIDKTKFSDCVLWGGDMNFRVDMPHHDVSNLCKEEKYKEILQHDEFLTTQQKLGGIYGEFKEAEIGFPPTYKFDLQQTDDVYAAHRTPSYTDRILYRDKPTSTIECTQYKSVRGVKHSDHKPVLAHFQVKLKPGLNSGDLSYGKFNHEVYKRGCKQRERHHSLGIDLRPSNRRRVPVIPKSPICVLQ